MSDFKFQDIQKLWKLKGLNSYSPCCFLNKTVWGKVALFQNVDTQKKFAGKIVTNSKEGEAYYWPTLRHVNIMKFIERVNISEDIHILLMPLLGMSLYEFKFQVRFYHEDFPFHRKKAYIEDILWGLDYLHGKKLCLMNINEKNIWIWPEMDTAVIGNFSCLTDMRNATVEKYSVCDLYQPPEIINLGPSETFNCILAELWSCGVMILQLFCGDILCHMLKPRFTVTEAVSEVINFKESITYEMLFVANPGPELASDSAVQFRNFIRQFLQINPEFRFPARRAALDEFLKDRMRLTGINDKNIKNESVDNQTFYTNAGAYMNSKDSTKMNVKKHVQNNLEILTPEDKISSPITETSKLEERNNTTELRPLKRMPYAFANTPKSDLTKLGESTAAISSSTKNVIKQHDIPIHESKLFNEENNTNNKKLNETNEVSVKGVSDFNIVPDKETVKDTMCQNFNERITKLGFPDNTSQCIIPEGNKVKDAASNQCNNAVIVCENVSPSQQLHNCENGCNCEVAAMLRKMHENSDLSATNEEICPLDNYHSDNAFNKNGVANELLYSCEDKINSEIETLPKKLVEKHITSMSNQISTNQHNDVENTNEDKKNNSYICNEKNYELKTKRINVNDRENAAPDNTANDASARFENKPLDAGDTNTSSKNFSNHNGEKTYEVKTKNTHINQEKGTISKNITDENSNACLSHDALPLEEKDHGSKSSNSNSKNHKVTPKTTEIVEEKDITNKCITIEDNCSSYNVASVSKNDNKSKKLDDYDGEKRYEIKISKINFIQEESKNIGGRDNVSAVDGPCKKIQVTEQPLNCPENMQHDKIKIDLKANTLMLPEKVADKQSLQNNLENNYEHGEFVEHGSTIGSHESNIKYQPFGSKIKSPGKKTPSNPSCGEANKNKKNLRLNSQISEEKIKSENKTTVKSISFAPTETLRIHKFSKVSTCIPEKHIDILQASSNKAKPLFDESKYQSQPQKKEKCRKLFRKKGKSEMETEKAELKIGEKITSESKVGLRKLANITLPKRVEGTEDTKPFLETGEVGDAPLKCDSQKVVKRCKWYRWFCMKSEKNKKRYL